METNAKVQYDEHVKQLLAKKTVLAHILQSTVEELKAYTVDEIISYTSNEILVSRGPVDPGETNRPDAILGDNTESAIPYEGKMFLDIRLHLMLPGKEEQNIKLLINLEAQKDYYQKYHLATRGVFYVARMISAQLGTEFTHSNYQDMKKVYSIWICMNAPDYIGNALTEYKIKKKDIVGHTPDIPESYDKLSVVFLMLNEKEDKADESIFRFLNTLLSPTLSGTDKQNRLKQEFGIDNKKENIGEELRTMCNLSEAIEERGIKQGTDKGIQILIKTCKELQVSQDDTIRRIAVEYEMPEEKAKEKVDQYWETSTDIL